MSDQDPNSSVEPPQPGAGDPGAGDPGAGADPNAGGGQPGGTPTPPPPDDWAGVPDNVRQAVEKRLGAMTAKNKTLEDRLATYEAGRGAQPGSSPDGGEGGGDEPGAFASYETWKKQALGNDSKAIALFDGFQQAMMADIDRAVQWFVESKIAPLMKGQESMTADGFYRGNAAAQAMREKIEARVKQTPGLSREDAFKILNYGAPPPRPPKAPPPGLKPGAPGAPSAPKDLPRGKGFGAIVEAVAESKGL